LAENAVLPTIPVSAVSGQGIDILVKVIENKIAGEIERIHIYLEPEELSLLDWLYRHGSDHHQTNCDNGKVMIGVNLTRSAWHIFQAQRSKLKEKGK